MDELPREPTAPRPSSAARLPATARVSEARDRLVRTAGAIFYAEGIHGVGVDRLVAEARVTRATFYRHFPGKEDLVVTYLRGVDAEIRSTIEQAARTSASSAALMREVARAIGDDLCRPGFRGCAFINAAAEYPDPGSPVHGVVLEHRAWLRETLVAALGRAGHGEPERAGRLLVMLRDGAVVAGYLGDPESARETFLREVDAIVREAERGRAGEESASSRA